MSGYYKQMRRRGEARRGLRNRIAREEMGDAAYEEMISQSDGRSFKIAAVLLIAIFAVAVFAVTALGY